MHSPTIGQGVDKVAAFLAKERLRPFDVNQCRGGVVGDAWTMQSQRREMAMVTSHKQTVKCICCGGRLTALDKCTDEELVCSHWMCPKCGCAFDASTSVYQDAPLAHEIVEEILPDLLVA